ncbi:hypothetical protein OAD42_02705 [Oceanospirillaceae bacterium]|nr:hypothetical protein [Oceanospirillaceae bacterium]
MKEVISKVYILHEKQKLVLEEQVLSVSDNSIVAETGYSALSHGTEKAA